MRNLLAKYNLANCDNFYINHVGYSFGRELLQQYSLINHLYICSSDISIVKEYKVVDSGSIISFQCTINATLVFECQRPNDLADEQVYQQRNDSSVFKQLPEIVLTLNNSLLHKNAANAALFDVNITNVVRNVEIIVETVVIVMI